MHNLNRVLLMGYLGNDPEQKTSEAGQAFTTFSLATNRLQKDPETPPQTDWHRIYVWGSQSQTCAQYLNKGAAVLVEGSLLNSTKPSEDGIKMKHTFIQARRVHFLQRNAKIEAHIQETNAES